MVIGKSIGDYTLQSSAPPGTVDALTLLQQDRDEVHFEDEEARLFPKLEVSDVDLMSLGARLAERKLELGRTYGHVIPYQTL